MSQSVPLEREVEARLAEIGEVDLLVGIPSYNSARTIGHVVRAVTAGFAKYFPDRRTLIVNSDGGSRDGTPAVVASADFATPATILVSHPLTPVHKIVTPYHGIPGKGSAFRTIFAIADGWARGPAPWWTRTCAASRRSGSSCCSRPCCIRASTTSRRSTCATSTTARSPTRSSIR